VTDYRRLRVALLGAGAVGSQVASLLLRHGSELADRAGASLELVGIAVRDVDAPRDVDLPRELFTTDAETLIVGSDIVIELMGGIEPARSYVHQAINSGADVVTANKALLATHGPEIFDAADQVGAQVYYEAAAAGAIPIIRPLRDSLAGDRVQRIMGIVNGTTNYILDRMDTEGAELADVLADAQRLGYAEADPTADVEGFDAAQKAAILASLAFHTTVPLETVHREGISGIDKAMMDAARHAGYVIKLLAVCERLTGESDVSRHAASPLLDNQTRSSGESISVRVYPALISRAHPLASVHGANNAVFVQAEAAGNLMFYGAGAGGVQTASAVLGDVVSAARRHIAGGVGVGESTRANLPIVEIGRVVTRYQITLEVDDEPGVLATIAGILSEGRVSIATVEQTVVQEANGHPGVARLVIGTHKALEQDLSETVDRLAASGVVERVVSVLRVEGD